MNKIEELKQKHRFTNVPEEWQGKSFYLTESELDEYAQQVSIDFANHLSGIVTNGDDLFSFEEEYVNWFKDQ